MRVVATLVVVVAALAAGPVHTHSLAQKAGDSERIADLEQRVKALEQKLAEFDKRLAESGRPSQRQEAAAAQLLKQAQDSMAAGRIELAKTKLDELNRRYVGTSSQRKANSLSQELAVIGKDAPASYEIEKWFQGEGEFDLGDGKPTLLVFWEQWCPHCRREIPKMQDVYDRYKPRGLQLVALTKVTRSSTEESVAEFCREQNVTYPIAKETGALSSYFNVSGVPAAAVVKDGKVIWRGHPANITDEIIENWIGG